MVNLDDTRRCPVAPECEVCGRLDELAVVTGDRGRLEPRRTPGEAPLRRDALED